MDKKIIISKELADTIKNERIKNNIRASEVAKILEKSNSYITKLENAEIQTIKLDVLYKMFELFIAKAKKNDSTIDKDEYMEKLLEKANIDSDNNFQEWMTTFDLQYRQLPLHKDLIQYVNDKLIQLNKTPQQIIEMLNSNNELNPDEFTEANKVYANYTDTGLSISIRYQLDINILENILKNKEDTINYINMLGIIYTILKLEGLSTDEAQTEARAILYQYKFYTLYEKQSIIKNALKEDIAYEKIYVSKEDTENRELVETLMDRINYLSELNIKILNERLTTLNNNLFNDPSLTLGVLGIDLTKLKKINTDLKRQFIKDVKKLVEEYSEKDKETLVDL
jgi:transcriptional regulator with XRE-family HTH domain